MPEPTEDDYKHWGMACYCFSLDLAQGLTAFAIPAVEPARIRQACREAILRNREHLAQIGRPAYLRDLVAQAWQGPDHAAFDTYVERVFISPARRVHLDQPLLRPLANTGRLATADAALGDELEGRGYAASVYGLIPQEASELLFDMVMAVDNVIDEQTLTPWDSDLIARNSEIHSPESPLALIIHTQMRHMEGEAARAVYARLSGAAQQSLDSACEEPAHAAG